jgi:hypothetical protein
MKTIRKPITDIYNRDFSTGKIVEVKMSETFYEQVKKSKEKFEAKEVVNGKIYVE